MSDEEDLEMLRMAALKSMQERRKKPERRHLPVKHYHRSDPRRSNLICIIPVEEKQEVKDEVQKSAQKFSWSGDLGGSTAHCTGQAKKEESKVFTKFDRFREDSESSEEEDDESTSSNSDASPSEEETNGESVKQKLIMQDTIQRDPVSESEERDRVCLHHAEGKNVEGKERDRAVKLEQDEFDAFLEEVERELQDETLLGSSGKLVKTEDLPKPSLQNEECLGKKKKKKKEKKMKKRKKEQERCKLPEGEHQFGEVKVASRKHKRNRGSENQCVIKETASHSLPRSSHNSSPCCISRQFSGCRTPSLSPSPVCDTWSSSRKTSPLKMSYDSRMDRGTVSLQNSPNACRHHSRSRSPLGVSRRASESPIAHSRRRCSAEKETQVRPLPRSTACDESDKGKSTAKEQELLEARKKKFLTVEPICSSHGKINLKRLKETISGLGENPQKGNDDSENQLQEKIIVPKTDKKEDRQDHKDVDLRALLDKRRLGGQVEIVSPEKEEMKKQSNVTIHQMSVRLKKENKLSPQRSKVEDTTASLGVQERSEPRSSRRVIVVKRPSDEPSQEYLTSKKAKMSNKGKEKKKRIHSRIGIPHLHERLKVMMHSDDDNSDDMGNQEKQQRQQVPTFVSGKRAKVKCKQKFAQMKRMINPRDSRIKEKERKAPKKKPPDPHELHINHVPQMCSALFFEYNTQLGPPYHILVDTNFVNFSIKNKLDIVQSMMDCLYAKCIPYITDCVLGELEKLGRKYRVALKIVKDPRFQRLPCLHKGTYADDCLVQRVTQHKCYIVATCDKDLRRRIRKIPGVPIMYLSQHRCQNMMGHTTTQELCNPPCDEFRRAFRYYKQRRNLPSLSNVLDIHAMNEPACNETEKVEKISSPVGEQKSTLNLEYLIPCKEWEVFTFIQRPGLVYVKNPFTKEGQHYWCRRCLRDFTLQPPYLTNMGKCGSWWEAYKNSGWNRHMKERLRWATLGYHHDWNTKVYTEEGKSEFPEDLGILCHKLGVHLQVGDFTAQAAIVNFYHPGSTLAPHTDHSEMDLSSPLFSFSFGQRAVFLIGGATRDITPLALLLHSGDILVMSGESRLSYHAIPRIAKGLLFLTACKNLLSTNTTTQV
ncbi:unnamed protein product [Darwinula stevensoni]|uniref:rRNA-processing protein FCF1 homolog n=1 Tax=Darwinula stevensoni TaxID=69355 RepID=A0A7R8X214_9CRUS|nr:unnamed protein product [Darwinula stevensoni]CAG0882873.1 unnamed protein product [Darwinula stevensoni]